jgi:serine/threonine protein phosphatase PrpC
MRTRASVHTATWAGGLLRSLVPWGAWALVGVLLWSLPGRFPPPAWITLWTLLHAQQPVPLLHLLLGCSQAAALALSWLGWGAIAFRLARHRSFARPTAPWPQDGATTLRAPESSLPHQGTIPSSMILQEPQDLTGHARDLSSHMGDTSYQPPGEGNARLATLLTASSNGMGAALPLHALARVSSSTSGGEPAEQSYDLVISGWCQAGISPLDREPEDSLLVATGEALLHEGSPQTAVLGLLAVADGRQRTSEHGQDSSSRQALAVFGATLLCALARDASPDEASLTATLLASIEQARTRLPSPAFDQEEGTALAAVLVFHRTAYLASLGHCRAYVYRESTGFCQITADHAVIAQEQRDMDSDSLPARLSSAHSLYRSLERETPAGADHYILPLQESDLLLLCTDGCWRAIEPDLFAELVAGCARRLPTDPLRLSAVLHEQLLSRGGYDAASLLTLAVLGSGEAEDLPATGKPGRRRLRTTPPTSHRGRGSRTRTGEGEVA